MNELGLTRENIREIAEDVIKSVVAKHIANLATDGYLDKLVNRELKELVKDTGVGARYRSGIDDYVRRAAEQQVKDYLAENLYIGKRV